MEKVVNAHQGNITGFYCIYCELKVRLCDGKTLCRHSNIQDNAIAVY